MGFGHDARIIPDIAILISCFVYRSYFQNSSLADIYCGYTFWANYYGNTSVASNRFFVNACGALTSGAMTLF